MSDKEKRRKCFKCGCSPAEDNITLFRYPKPGVKNILRCEQWAKYIFPERECSSTAFHAKLFSEHRMLCQRHFKDTDFADSSTKKKLVRCAVPNDAEHQTPILPVYSVECVGNSNISGNQSKNQTVVSNHSKNEPAVSGHSKNEPAVSDHSKNETAVSDHSKNQTAVNINEQDAVDDSQFLAGVDTHTDDDDCHNISDDDCQVVIDDDSSFYHNESKPSDDKDDLDMEPHNIDKNEDLHDGFKCNFCSGEIKGYRYTCVQCPDYDLCSSCEARGAHCLHYVLRIPRPKPLTEIQPLLRAIRRLLSGEDTDVLWTQADVIKEEESNDEVDPLDFDCVTPTLSETEDNVPEITNRTSITKSHGNRQDNTDAVPEVTMQPLLTSRLHVATTHTSHKKKVSVDKRSAASTSSPSTTLIASNRNTLLPIESSPQTIDKTRKPVSESSQYTVSTRLAPDGNTVLTIEFSPQAIDNTRIPVSASSPNPALARLAPKRNTLSTIEFSPKAIDKTRTTVSESSQYTASTSVSSDGKTVLTIATNVEDTDSTSRSVPSTSRLYASSSITPGDTETIYNKKIIPDSRLQVPMATKRKCSENIEASKQSPVVLLKGSKKLIVVPSISTVIGPGTRFRIIKQPSATGQPQAQGAVHAARHRTQSTQRDQDAPR